MKPAIILAAAIVVGLPLFFVLWLGFWTITRDIFCPIWLASGMTYSCRAWEFWHIMGVR